MLSGDTVALLECLESVSPGRLAYVAKKHRMGAMLCEALRDCMHNDYARAVYRRLERTRWSVAALAHGYRQQVVDVMRILSDVQVRFVFLKGASRAFLREAGYELHQSSDIDVLVAPEDVDRACSALRSAGYATNAGAAIEGAYRTKHHHAAPLYPAHSGVPVEIHRALRSDLLDSTTLHDLAKHIRLVCIGGIQAEVFDENASALHIAVHNAPRAILRDVALLAELLKKSTADSRRELRALIKEHANGDIRALAVAAFASEIAGTQWEADVRARRLVRWMVAREDLPRPLRARPEAMDAWIAAQPSRLRAIAACMRGAATAKTAVARAAAAVVTAFYLPFMR